MSLDELILPGSLATDDLFWKEHEIRQVHPFTGGFLILRYSTFQPISIAWNVVGELVNWIREKGHAPIFVKF